MAELPENDRIAGPFIATAGQTDFPADFPLIDPAALRFRRERAGEVAVLQGVSVSAVNLTEGAFTCRLATPAQAGDRCFVYSSLSPARLRQHTPNGATRSATLEGDAVGAQAQLQEHRRELRRTLAVPPGEAGLELAPAATRANGAVVFGPSGEVKTAAPLPGVSGILTIAPTGEAVVLGVDAITGVGGDNIFDGGLDGVDGSGQNFDGGMDG
ncbi:MAG: hypothetical protein ACT6TH_14580 [Brevundimonas sp.]|uniref:hypothetical protein n=1 Tax=Brevundimonas sp. TaxID=1871086 RepID=UPI0040336EAD